MKQLYIDILEDLIREGVPENFIMKMMDVAGTEGVRYVDYFDYIYDRWDAVRETGGVVEW